MKTPFFLLSIFIFLSTFVATPVKAQEGQALVQADIAQILRIITQAINEGTTETITNGVSPNARPELKEEIQRSLNNEPIEYSLSTDTITANDDLTYTVKGAFTARGISDNDVNWEISGIPVQFTFEKIDGGWWLKETNFHQRLGSEFTAKVVGMVFAIVGGFILLGLAIIIWKKRGKAKNSLNQSV